VGKGVGLSEGAGLGNTEGLNVGARLGTGLGCAVGWRVVGVEGIILFLNACHQCMSPRKWESFSHQRQLEQRTLGC
jgi:hypothetical protein